MLWKFRKKERRYNGFLLRLITPYENVIMNYSIPFSSKRHKSAFKSAQYWHFRVNMLYNAYVGPCFAWNHNTEAPGHSWCSTIKIPHCLKVHMPKVVTPLLASFCLHKNWIFISWTWNNEQTNKIWSLLIFLSLDKLTLISFRTFKIIKIIYSRKQVTQDAYRMSTA